MTVLGFPPILDASQALATFNKAFAVTVVGGRTRIAEPQCWDPTLKRHYVRFIPLADFKQMFANRRIRVPRAKGKTALVPIAEFWLAHPDRRQHLGGVVCDPMDQAGPDFLNVWQGLAVAPKPGDCGISSSTCTRSSAPATTGPTTMLSAGSQPRCSTRATHPKPPSSCAARRASVRASSAI